jgi:ABC-type multidrug transport system ATPase subunit
MQKEVAFSVALVGLNGSGKTTLVRSLLNSTEEVFPTAGFAIDFITVPKSQKPVLVYDCSG